MVWGEAARRLLREPQARVGLCLLVLGELLIVIRVRPLSDFYFPLAWFGLIFFLDAAVQAQYGRSFFGGTRTIFLAMIPLSALFWWLFEAFNLAVHSWSYIGGSRYTGIGFVVFASIDFSSVLLAVWCAARMMRLLIPGHDAPQTSAVPRTVLATMLTGGFLCLILPLLFPHYAFGLIWGCTAMILDPINAWLGRPSILRALRNRSWRLPASFTLGGLFCGFFWEAWNYWSLPKWIYAVPYVNFAHVFEMPLLGYAGYLPFGLEVFTMVNFVLPLVGLGTMTLDTDEPEGGHAQPPSHRAGLKSSARAQY
jgi:hypothetical protein